jgi:hypothetical protein
VLSTDSSSNLSYKGSRSPKMPRRSANLWELPSFQHKSLP